MMLSHRIKLELAFPRTLVRRYIIPSEVLARQVLSLSVDEAKRVRESIEYCEPYQESKPDC